jgi:hypothetical protein
VLVPASSPGYHGHAANKKGFKAPFRALWAAVQGPGSMALVVADEFCAEGLFHQQLGHAGTSARVPAASPLRGLDPASEAERASLVWAKPVFRNYW